ncbi:DUF3108 domain-containing protein [Hyphomicrobium methylovorum]|uniref:DUF3108 domain-containing protein n=1 Tax=Hyphomicrobium methylovorum TaxID=84 RepID=UPI0015E7B4CD|nr:DUF3108 domain-containing protein [Hyphomicrobium methylovorum]MBA2126005.1 DUF3108 domain-containing protein [Hyphomicrobium methylovorum]
MGTCTAEAPVRGVLFGVFVALAAFAAAPASATEAAWPSEVKGRYKLSFNGFEVGAYDFKSTTTGSTYTAVGNTKISALFGAFKWSGTFSSTGSVSSAGPQPAKYEMRYQTKSKTASVKMGFSDKGVKTIALVPNKPPAPETVKVKPENLLRVFDPVSATLAISNASGADACNRTIPIFDGKARFDLRLSLKGREAIKEKQASGQPRELVVCRVKYLPIAGHKPKDFVNPWIDYDHIEIALRAIPSAGIYVPYRITVPSTIGPAVMTAEEIRITSAGNAQIALRQ